MSSPTDLLARYRHFRDLSIRLNEAFTRQIPKDVLDQAGRELGFVHNGTFVFNSKDETNILMDHCLYGVLRDGRNMIQNLLAQSPPPEGSDELTLLQAKAKAWYSVFMVGAVERGIGLRVKDVLRESEHFLVDVNLSQTVAAGVMLATRVIPMEGYIMTSGAALPLGGSEGHRERFIQSVSKTIFANNIASFERLTPQQETALARAIIKSARSVGATAHMSYANPGRIPRPMGRQALVPVPVGGRVGRNDPCPCGSGKKFKKCCAKA